MSLPKIAGLIIARILAKYGANVIKLTGPGLSDVPFFQVGGNIGKHATKIDLKNAEGRKTFELLLKDVDICCRWVSVRGFRQTRL